MPDPELMPKPDPTKFSDPKHSLNQIKMLDPSDEKTRIRSNILKTTLSSNSP
jgi:hypothetical protein